MDAMFSNIEQTKVASLEAASFVETANGNAFGTFFNVSVCDSKTGEVLESLRLDATEVGPFLTAFLAEPVLRPAFEAPAEYLPSLTGDGKMVIAQSRFD